MIRKQLADFRLLAQLGASMAQIRHENVQDTGNSLTHTAAASRWGSAMAAALAKVFGPSCDDTVFVQCWISISCFQSSVEKLHGDAIAYLDIGFTNSG